VLQHEYQQNLRSITIGHENLAERQQSLLEKLNSQLVASTLRFEYFRKLSAKAIASLCVASTSRYNKPNNLKKQMEAMDSDMSSLRALVDASSSEVARLRDELSASESSRQELLDTQGDWHDHVEELEQKCLSLEQRVVLSDQSRSALSRELEASHVQLSTLREAVKGHENALSAARSSASADMESELASLRALVDASSSEVARLRDELSVSESSRQELLQKGFATEIGMNTTVTAGLFPLRKCYERYLSELRLLDNAVRRNVEKKTFDEFDDDVTDIVNETLMLMEDCLVELTWVRDVAVSYSRSLQSKENVDPSERTQKLDESMNSTPRKHRVYSDGRFDQALDSTLDGSETSKIADAVVLTRLAAAYKNECSRRKKAVNLIRQQNLCILAQRSVAL
jgi:chromosome segregation ATPase